MAIHNHSAFCHVLLLGRVDYLRAWEVQRAIAQQVAEGHQPHTLLLLEHPHVYTLGRRGKEIDVLWDEAELARRGVQVHWVDRGGEATYHGPGQLVGFPILDLHALGAGPLKYVRTLEQVLIRTLADFGIGAGCIQGLTGVWVGQRKIAAIGVKISRGVTTHGFALNVNPDLSYFEGVVPCGIADKGVTSMQQLLGRQVEMEDVAHSLAGHFGREFGLKVAWAGPGDDIWKTVDVYLQAAASPSLLTIR